MISVPDDGHETMCVYWLEQGAVVTPVLCPCSFSAVPDSASTGQLAQLSKYSCSAGKHSMPLSSLHQHRSFALLTYTA